MFCVTVIFLAAILGAFSVQYLCRKQKEFLKRSPVVMYLEKISPKCNNSCRYMILVPGKSSSIVSICIVTPKKTSVINFH